MKVFVTPPIQNLELSELGDNNFYVLGQLYKKSEEYREYTRKAREAGRFLILDSGVGDEGEVLTNEELFELTLEIRPNEVIPLDVLYDKDQTIANFEEFVRWSKQPYCKLQLKYTSILACPQGKDYDDWMECYKYFLKNPEVSCIGMSKKAIPHVMNMDIANSRVKMVKTLQDQFLIRKPLHFLGQGDPLEFTYYPRNNLFRSTDSCYPILSALNDQDLESLKDEKKEFNRIPTPKDYFELYVTSDKNELVVKNVIYLKECLNCKTREFYGQVRSGVDVL